MNKKELHNMLSYLDEEIMTMDGFEDAFIGISKRCGQPSLATYSFNKMVWVLVERDSMTQEEAIEYIEYNCAGAWMGDLTPVILYDLEDFWEEPYDKQEVYNECYMCEQRYVDILDLISHIRDCHKDSEV